jgi:hypothetical protein
MNGAVAVGTALPYSREDHVHPTDTSRQPLDGDLTAIAALTGANTIYYRQATDTWSPVTIGSGLTFTGGTLTASSSGTTPYRFQTATAPPPGNGNIRFNAATPAATTTLYINNVNDAGTDVSRVLLNLSVGTKIVIQGQSTATDYADFTVASTPVANTGYVSIGVTYLDSGGVISNNEQIILASVGAGTGGGASPSTANPLMNGVAAPGTALPYSREDHVHPVDTGRAPLASPTFTGDPKAPTPAAGDNDTSIATTAFVTSAVAAGGGGLYSGGMRNLIINGDFQIDSRYAFNGVSVGTSDFIGDHWNVQASQASKLTAYCGVSASTIGIQGLSRVYQFIVSGTVPSLAAGDVFMIQQRVEGFIASRLNWGNSGALPATISLWMYSSIAGTYPISFRNSAGNRSYVTTVTFAAPGWNKFTVTIPGDTTGAWLYTSGIGISVAIGLALGSTFQAPSANSWQAGNYITAPGCVNFMATNGAGIYLGQIQLEAGSVATPFEYRHIGVDATLCSRYFQKVIGPATGIQVQGYQAAGGTMLQLVTFPVMRQTPSGSMAGLLGTWTTSNCGAPSFSPQTPSSALLYAVVTALGSASFANPANGGYQLDAEL